MTLISGSDSELLQGKGRGTEGLSLGQHENNHAKDHAGTRSHPPNVRDRLQAMGSLMDDSMASSLMDDEENSGENQQPRPRGKPMLPRPALQTTNANPSLKPAPLQQATDKLHGTATRNNNHHSINNENSINNNNTSHQLDATPMMRQHRRRLVAGGQVVASILSPHHNGILAEQPSWNGLVQKGARLKSFLDGALQQVATGYVVTHGTKRQRSEQPTQQPQPQDQDEHDGSMATLENERDHAVAKIAKEKTHEAILLQQKLEESQAQVAALMASNETLREETTESSLRFERTIEALKIAAANAACARTDADQAETSAEGLATQLEALKTVVDQTKQAAQLLHEEQEEISAQARNGQAKLLQVEAELARSQKETKQLRQKAEEWQSKANQLQEETVSLKRQLADKTEQARKLTTALEERDALEEARKKRSQQVEQALLIEATSAAANGETLQSLNESVEQLQTANQKLHEELVAQQEAAREEKERLRESLLLAEKDAQQLRIEASLQKDQTESQTQNKTSDNEKGNAAVSPDGGDLEHDDTSFFSCTTTLNMRTPTPKSTTGRDSHAVPPAATCSICFKAAFGLMKSCQCGRPNCDKRAHLTCANQINPGPSVSHPGTPAPKLPIVLCSGALSGIMIPN